MLFNSLNFTIFLPIVFILYWFVIKGYLRNNRIEISFFLALYHPKVYSFISKSEKYRQIIESEKHHIYL